MDTQTPLVPKPDLFEGFLWISKKGSIGSYGFPFWGDNHPSQAAGVAGDPLGMVGVEATCWNF